MGKCGYDYALLDVKPKGGAITAGMAFSAITAFLASGNPRFKELLGALDYCTCPSYAEGEALAFGDGGSVLAYAVPGGSEGVYTDLAWQCGSGSALSGEGRRLTIGVFKTLEEGPGAFAGMGELSGLLAWGAWQFIDANYDALRG